MNVYPSTKFAVSALSEVLTNELLGNKIRVTVKLYIGYILLYSRNVDVHLFPRVFFFLQNLSPGYVITDLVERAVDKKGSLTGIPALRAEDVADAVAYVIATPAHVQITQLTIKPLGEPF